MLLYDRVIFVTGRGARQFAEAKTLKLREVGRIKEVIPGIVEAVPFFDVTYPARYGEKSLTASIVGTTEAIFG